jgi:hypothetical protein
MRAEKREFAWEFSQLSRPGQTRTRVAWELTGYYKLEWELTRVEKREFTWEFSQLSCPGQTRTRVAWELTGYYRARSENSHQNYNQFKVHESWLSNAIEICNSHQLSPRLSEAFCLCLSLWLVPKGWYTTHPISWPSFNRPRWTCFSLLFYFIFFYFNFYLYWKQ